jgi:hypothetical protein
MSMVPGEEPRLLEGQAALGLEVGAWRTRPVPTGVVPEAGHLAVGTGWHMAAQRRGATRHEGGGRFAPMRGQGVGPFVRGRAWAEDVVQGQEPHVVPQQSHCENPYRLF